MRYRPEIDGLRAVAVLPVLFFHAGFEAFSGGFVGVDIFFVISGYLITSIISEEINSGTFTVTRFYERRARRILPAIFAVAFVCIPFAWLWMFPAEFKDFSQSLVAVATFSSNILFWLESGYFEATAELKPLLHTWSLSVEEQFYVFFPLLLLLIRGLSGYKKIAMVGAITILSLAAAVYGANTNPSANFYLIPTRAWELGVGALLAMTKSVDWTIPRSIRDAAAALGIAMIVYSIVVFDETTPFPSLYTVMPVLGTALVIVAATGATTFGRMLSLPLFVGVGLISYSLYLWHQPILAFIRLRSLYEPSRLVMMGAIVLALALSVLTWKYVEAPFRNKQRVSRRVLVGFSVAGSLLMLTAGLVGHFADGFADINDSRAFANAFQERVRVNFGLSRTCEDKFTLSEECRTSDHPEIVVWGDSYAMHLVDGILAAKPGVGLVQMTKSVCGPILDLAPVTAKWPAEWAKGCLEFNRHVFDWLSKTSTVKIAVLSSPFGQYLHPANKYLTNEGIVEKADPRIAAQAFANTLDMLKAIGITPIVVSPPPKMGQDIGLCLKKAAHFGVDGSSCNFPRSQYEKYSASVIQFLKHIESRHTVVWLDEMMCDSETCKTVTGNVLLYRDQGHLSHEGSRYLGRSLNFLSDASASTAQN